MDRWDIQRVTLSVNPMHDAALQNALDDGWEPFAVTTESGWHTYFLRKNVGALEENAVAALREMITDHG